HSAKDLFLSKLLKRTADPRNLKCAWDWLATGDGQAAGIDGLHYTDLDDQEVWNLIRTVSQAILDGTYRPAEDLLHRIPKNSGKGFRQLAIPTVVDRMVQRGIVQILQPYLDEFFDDNSLGYRPGCNSLLALARAEAFAIQGECWCWITEDIRDAFDQVPQQ